MEPTNRELKIMLDNSVQRSDERHQEVLGVLDEIKTNVEAIKAEDQRKNYRMIRIEEWSAEAKKMIEGTAKLAGSTASQYGKSETRLYTAIGVGALLLGTIITLSILVLNAKIKNGISMAFKDWADQYEIKVDNNH